MQDIREILKEHWGYDNFRPMQEDIIRSVLAGTDTLAILPTGGGKSICFQVPAMATEGLTIVISPLIALMKDQVENLRKRDIPALLIHSGMKRADVIQTLRNATHDYFKFLYLSPERLETSLFREYLPALPVNLIAVDEAHCISQWGYDFRPSYLKIADLRKELPHVPVLALTASATEEVQADIMAKLDFRRHQVFRQSFERKNLSYSVFKVESKLSRLCEIISKVAGSGIVYCKSRRRTQEIASLLQMQGISASHYHAGLDGDERNKRQKDWIDNKVRVMVCTNAFGMGIDKPDVRIVVHADVPDCLENYYQEAGRAGRDGQKSYAVLLFDEQDIAGLEQQHLLRFPSMDFIREVYRALVNFLQVPAYSGEYQRFVFKLDEFCTRFALKSTETLYALKTLESDGWMEFNEKSFIPSTLVFTTSKNSLHDFQVSFPEHEPLLTTLLRSYGGIFDFPAFISEKLLAKLLKKDEAGIRQQLMKITAHGIISYTPQSEDPQLLFLKQRVPAEELVIKTAPYQKRKESFMSRVHQMILYTATAGCRSQFINNYFGDHASKRCGICDNCLKEGGGNITTEEFAQWSSFIVQKLKDQPLSADDLLQSIHGRAREKAWKVIHFLESENKIRVDQLGKMHLVHS